MDRVAQENTKSQGKSSDEAISAIYAVISSYNGIIRTIIERTEPAKGKWSTRKSVDQSTVMYLAEVLKGLIEPLKHLEFQLNQVNDPELASLQSMMNNLVKIIDESPPFKALDVNIFKNGIPNYEGLADDLDITDTKAYLALLKSKKEKLQFKVDNLTKVKRPGQGEVSQKIFKQAKDSLDALNKEIRKTKHLVDAKLEDLYVDGSLLTNIDDLENALDQFELPNRDEVLTIDDIQLERRKNVGKKVLTSELKKEKQILEKQKKNMEEGYLVENPDLKDDKGNFDAQRLPTQHKKAYLEILEDISKVENKLGPKYDAKDVKEQMAAAETKGTARKNAEQEVAFENAPPSATAPTLPPVQEGIEGVGIGNGRPLADLLANPKQQYNYMQRPISDDQKIQNDMIKANRNWQIKNNVPHDTPLGNLNPFLAQDDASKYSYEVLLAAENAKEHPDKNALGADVSLLQGPISTIEGSGKKSKALLRLKNVAIDERNDPYKKVELGTNGMIPEEKEDQFKLPDLKPKKRK